MNRRRFTTWDNFMNPDIDDNDYYKPARKKRKKRKRKLKQSRIPKLQVPSTIVNHVDGIPITSPEIRTLPKPGGQRGHAIDILEEIGHAMTLREMGRRMMEGGYISSYSRTPQNTVSALITVDNKRLGDNSFLVRPNSGYIGLRKWL